MVSATNSEEVPIYHEADRAEAVRVAMIGVIVGVLIPLLGWVVTQLILRPIFCQDPSGGACTSTGMIGYYISSVLMAIVAVPVLASWGVFRGLLIVASAAVALWGLPGSISALASGSWLEYGLFSAVLFGLAYLLFYWVMRLRNFGFSLAVALVAVLALRWALLT